MLVSSTFNTHHSHFIEISEVLVDEIQIRSTPTGRSTGHQISSRSYNKRSVRRTSIVPTTQSKEKMSGTLESVIGLGLGLGLGYGWG
jgi:hypothetical protein